jgi:hypothetical protein
MSNTFTNIRNEIHIAATSADLPIGVTIGSIGIAADTGNIYTYDGSVWNAKATSGGVTAHSALTGLSNDDHTQYALLAGRSGGQTLKGDTASAGNLTLNSTAHATKGKLIVGAAAAIDEANKTLVIGAVSASVGAILDAQGTSGGIGFPILTDTQRNAITPGRAGVMIWNTDNGRFEYWNGGGWASAAPIFNHNSLDNLTVGDVHTQYALLAGRSGGQSINGDTASAGNITVNSTAHATKGNIIMGGTIKNGISGNETAAILGTAATTTYLKVLLSDGSTAYIPLVTTPN